MSLVGKTIPRRLHRLTSFSIVTARLVAGTAFSADNKNSSWSAAGALARRANREAYHGPECPAILMICWIFGRFVRDPEGVNGVSATARARRMAVFPKLV